MFKVFTFRLYHNSIKINFVYFSEDCQDTNITNRAITGRPVVEFVKMRGPKLDL